MALSQDFVLVDPTQHDLKSFDCGKPKMNEFLARYSFKNMQLGLSSTWVLPALGESHNGKEKIAAYYTLASSTVGRAEIPTDKNLPLYPVPVVMLARLAVDSRYQRQKLGEKTLIIALRKSVELTRKGLPAHCLVLDVLDEEAQTFYERYEMFEPFHDDPMRLFVSMNVLEKI